MKLSPVADDNKCRNLHLDTIQSVRYLSTLSLNGISPSDSSSQGSEVLKEEEAKSIRARAHEQPPPKKKPPKLRDLKADGDTCYITNPEAIEN